MCVCVCVCVCRGGGGHALSNYVPLLLTLKVQRPPSPFKDFVEPPPCFIRLTYSTWRTQPAMIDPDKKP